MASSTADINEFRIDPVRTGRHRRHQNAVIHTATPCNVKTRRINRRVYQRRIVRKCHGGKHGPPHIEDDMTVDYKDFTDGTEMHIAGTCKYVKGRKNGRYVNRKVCYCPRDPDVQVSLDPVIRRIEQLDIECGKASRYIPAQEQKVINRRFPRPSTLGPSTPRPSTPRPRPSAEKPQEPPVPQEASQQNAGKESGWSFWSLLPYW